MNSSQLLMVTINFPINGHWLESPICPMEETHMHSRMVFKQVMNFSQLLKVAVPTYLSMNTTDITLVKKITLNSTTII